MLKTVVVPLVAPALPPPPLEAAGGCTESAVPFREKKILSREIEKTTTDRYSFGQVTSAAVHFAIVVRT